MRAWPMVRHRLALAGLLALGAPAGSAMAQDAPREHIGPFADIDWSLGLRGSYAVSSSTGGAAELQVLPELSWTRQGGSTKSVLGVGGQFAVSPAGAINIDDAHGTAEGQWMLGPETILKGSSTLTFDQLRATNSSLPATTTIGPTELTGTVNGSAEQDFAHVRVTGRLGGTRYIEGETTLSGGATVSNAENSYWQGAAGLRLGYDLGPLITVFIDGDAKYTAYDAPSSTLLAYENGRTLTLRAGVSYARDSRISAELSAGRAWYDYDDPTLTDAPSWVVDGSLTLKPDETLSLTGSVETTLAPSSLSAGDIDAGLTATGNLRYALNPWVALRSEASYNRTVALGSGLSSWGYSAGAGIDLTTSRFATWTGDYSFAHDEPATGAATDTHTVTVGVTVHR